MSRGSGVSRRTVMKGAVAGATGLAGCTTSGIQTGGNESAEVVLRIGSTMTAPGSAWKGEQPSGQWEFKRRIEKRTNGRIQVKNIADDQLCGELSCPSKVRQDIIEVGSASIGNSSMFYPMNDIWMLPYTFPNRESLSHVHQKPETWERWWIPFAQKYNVVPLWMHAPTLRSINIGTSRTKSKEHTHRLPKHVQGMNCRRTASQVSGKCLNAWGMNPVSVSWADSLQGLRTGVVGGMESAISPICAYQGNMAEACGESIHNQWTIHNDVKWANVDWIKSLPKDKRTVLADESRKIFRDLVRMNGEIHQQRLGTHTAEPGRPEKPQKDSCIEKHNLKVNYIKGEDRKKWKDMVTHEKNPDLYTGIIQSADQIGVNGEQFHQYLKESARESSVPNKWENFTVDAWWDDYLQEI